jgi:transcriptional regulator GlxA family with amidase domain
VLQQIIVLHSSDTATPLVLQNHSRLLLHLLGQIRFDLTAQRPSHEYRRVEAAQAQICKDLAEPPGLAQLAHSLGISVRQLQRDFLACTGMTPIRYVNLMRLSEANLLLAETRLPISEIAAQLGYTSPGHFSAAFRRAYDCSPRDVREPSRLVGEL